MASEHGQTDWLINVKESTKSRTEQLQGAKSKAQAKGEAVSGEGEQPSQTG